MLGPVAAAGASTATVELYKSGKVFCGCIKKDFDFANDLEKNYKNLRQKAENLYARMEVREAEAKEHKTQHVNEERKLWNSRVMKEQKEVQKLITKFENEQSKKGKWMCLYCRRSKLSKSMLEKYNELSGLLSDDDLVPKLMVENLPERVLPMGGPKIEDKPSHYKYVVDVLKLLHDENVRRIGLVGMYGIGKTTIMKNLNDNKDVAEMFDIVIWVTVSKNWSMEKLQRAITDRLKLNVEGITNLDEIARRISLELECKKFLLLLDDVWEDFDLNEIGIHDNQIKSKVVLATTLKDVGFCMKAYVINMERMESDDAWKMFTENVDNNVMKKIPRSEPIARRAVRECQGLPFLIDKVARTFSKMGENCEWINGLSDFRMWSSIEVQGIDELVEFSKFCYEKLHDEDKKLCFLYGALYPEECEINKHYLLECWRAEGFINDADEFRDSLCKGRRILDELINLCLLDECEKKNHVRMNKLLRKMALEISSQSKKFQILVKASHDEEEWQQANGISLMDNKLCSLPQLPDCNNLSTLLLQRNHDLKVIPDTFFRCMKNLRVLDLHGTGIESLPSSISGLTCLRALYLNSCICLMELHHLEKLELLEVLDIRGTGINHLPIQIGSLVQLKWLRMSFSNFGNGQSRDVEFDRNDFSSLLRKLYSKFGKGQSRDVDIHQNVFSSLSLLEELRIEVDPNNRVWEALVDAVIEEVATLPRLTSLSICFPKVDCLKSFILKSPVWKDYFKFQFSVGYHDSTSYEILDWFKYPRCFKFANGEGVDPAISEVLAETDVFRLIAHKGASRLSDFGIENINSMRVCLIEGCDEIETIVYGNNVDRSALECLEKMCINNAQNLESIWEGPVHAGSLARLTTLTLQRCPKLKKIFSNGMIEQLFKLEHLSVEECPEIEEIITNSENTRLEPGALPKLKTLVLSDLPRVKSICTVDSLKWPALEKITISRCQLLTRLPLDKENAPYLRHIEGDQLWWTALEWTEDVIKGRFESFFKSN